MSNPRVELLTVALDLVRKLMFAAQRFEAQMMHWKVSLIEMIHGEQSKYGW
jgi:hypothetical protein